MKDYPKKLLLLLICFSFFNVLSAQDELKLDTSLSKDWPNECKKVEITSSTDQKNQLAYHFSAQGNQPRPLVISLHSWSGDYTQKDTLSWMCIKNNLNYIHPDFRGPNNTTEACGSPLVIQDIDDAIEYAIQNGKVDMSQIHIIGVSGGGHATLLAYMKTKYPIKTFSAWVPISNLVDWYYESVGRGQKYAKDIALATSGEQALSNDFRLDEAEAKSRSPYFMTTPTDRRQASKLYLYAGIHDGYTGSVPISQSLRFYNKVVQDFNTQDATDLISPTQMLSLIERRNTDFSHTKQAEKGYTHFKKQYQDKIQLVIFEGGHEMLPHLLLAQLGTN